MRMPIVAPAALPAIIYAVIIITAYLAIPTNLDPVNALMNFVTGFRIASGFTMSIFWRSLGLLLEPSVSDRTSQKSEDKDHLEPFFDNSTSDGAFPMCIQFYSIGY